MGVLLLVRHGQASLGTADYDRLSDIGRRQAQVTGARLARTDLVIDRVVSGGLTRQRDTAQALLAALGWPASRLRIDERLDEYDHVEVMARHTNEVTFSTATAEGEVGRALQSTLEEAIGRWISGETGYKESHAAFIDRVLAAIGHLVAEPVLAALGWPASRLRIDERLDEYDHVGVMALYTSEVTFETATADGERGRALQSTLEEAIGRWIAGDSGDGETHEAFIGRVMDSITELATAPGATIAVTSGGVIAAYCALALGLPAERWPGLARLIVNASITKIITGHTGTNMVTFNDHAHLETDRALITYR